MIPTHIDQHMGPDDKISRTQLPIKQRGIYCVGVKPTLTHLQPEHAHSRTLQSTQANQHWRQKYNKRHEVLLVQAFCTRCPGLPWVPHCWHVGMLLTGVLNLWFPTSLSYVVYATTACNNICTACDVDPRWFRRSWAKFLTARCQPFLPPGMEYCDRKSNLGNHTRLNLAMSDYIGFDSIGTLGVVYGAAAASPANN
jgi:hypothetical protein